MKPSEKHILDLVEVKHPRPTELLLELPMFEYSQIQEVLCRMILEGRVILTSDRHLILGDK